MPKGKKICPTCSKELWVRAKECECGYQFGDSMAVDVTDNTVISLKSRANSLTDKIRDIENRQDLSIASTDKTPRRSQIAPDPDVQRKVGGSRGLIYTPAGECPYTPKGYKKNWPDGPASDSVIQNWALAVYNSGDQYTNYHPHAIVYFATHFWNATGPDFKRVKNLILDALDPDARTIRQDDPDEESSPVKSSEIPDESALDTTD